MFQIPAEQLKASLTQDGIISAEDFDIYQAESKRMGQGIADMLISKSIITDEYYNNLLADFFGVKMANLDPASIDSETLNLIPEDYARSGRVITFKREADGTVDVAMEDPSDLNTIEFLETRLQSNVRPFLAGKTTLNSIFAFYGKQHV